MHIHHLFIPHHKNNHRAKLLHNITLFTLILVISFISSLSIFIHKSYPQVLGVSYNITSQELVNLTNFEREKMGLNPLVYNQSLSEAAQKKADYMFEHDFWAHYAPDGTTPWKFIKDEGYEYIYAGENLAKGYTRSTDTVSAWMNSPTHKANILSDQYAEIGFAIKEGKLQGEETVLVVQMFGTKDLAQLASNPGPRPVAQQVNGSEAVVNDVVTAQPIFNLISLAKGVTFVLLALLLIALILDFIIIEKKKIPRAVGNNLDHVILISAFVAFVCMAKLGSII